MRNPDPTSRFLLESRRAVIEELFLPAVEDRGLQAEFIVEIRDRLLVRQMPSQVPTFSSGVYASIASSCVSPSLLGEHLLHFQLNRNNIQKG